ncbi:hypothetical protein TMatcc_005431 [Talaromyces marneffei ATCC 18224]
MAWPWVAMLQTRRSRALSLITPSGLGRLPSRGWRLHPDFMSVTPYSQWAMHWQLSNNSRPKFILNGPEYGYT